MIKQLKELPKEAISQRDVIRKDINNAIKRNIPLFEFDDERYNKRTLAMNIKSLLKPTVSKMKFFIDNWYTDKVNAEIGFIRKDYIDPKKAYEAKTKLVLENADKLRPLRAQYEDYMERCNNAIRAKKMCINGEIHVYCMIDFELLEFCNLKHI